MDAEIVKAAEDIVKTLVLAGANLVEAKLLKHFANAKQVQSHLKKTLNHVGYFITYRPSRQRIDEAYVEPWLTRGCLSLTHLTPAFYNAYDEMLSNVLLSGSTRALGVPNNLVFSTGQSPLRIEMVDCRTLADAEENIIVLAEPGAGKTSLLSFLCFSRIKSGKPRLPVFLTSQMLDKSLLLPAIDAIMEPLGLSISEGKKLGAGIDLYLDGLDEIAEPQFKHVCAELRDLALQSPDLRITASCRNAEYQKELSFLDEVSIVPFDRQRIEMFTRAWFKKPGIEHMGNELISELDRSEQLEQIARQPLMLSLMCNAYRRYLKVSRRLSTLFDQCINALLWEWDADRKIKRGRRVQALDDLQKSFWLHCRLAVVLHEQKYRFVDIDTILSILVEELPRYGVRSSEAKMVLKEFCSGSGIVTKFTEETYGFAHLALQEYLAGKWYASEGRWRELVKPERLADPWWKEVIALCAASLSNATEMIKSMMETRSVSEVVLLNRLAHCLRQDPIVDPDLRNRLWRQVLSWYHNGDAEHHDAALDMIMNVEDDWSVLLIQESLKHKIPDKTMSEHLKRRPMRVGRRQL